MLLKQNLTNMSNISNMSIYSQFLLAKDLIRAGKTSLATYKSLLASLTKSSECRYDSYLGLLLKMQTWDPTRCWRLVQISISNFIFRNDSHILVMLLIISFTGFPVQNMLKFAFDYRDIKGAGHFVLFSTQMEGLQSNCLKLLQVKVLKNHLDFYV